MRRSILTLALFGGAVFPGNGAAQVAAPPDSGAIIDSIFAMIRDRSVHRGAVDWTALDSAFRLRIRARASFAEQLEEFRFVFERLEDVHSSVVYAGRQISWFRPVSAERSAALRPLIERASSQTGHVQVELLDYAVGYILIPTIYTAGRSEADSVARHIRRLICGLREVPAKWVIDLRLNMGGNLHPMLAALAPLIGDGDLGGIVNDRGQRVARWHVVDGVYLVDRVQTATVTGSCTIAPAERVAVIVGPITISSGEAVAIALRGRANTRLFGEPTPGGYTTANNWHALTDDLVLNLAEGFFADRSGTVYRQRVDPDAFVTGGDAFDSLPDDAKVTAALQWLGGAKDDRDRRDGEHASRRAQHVPGGS